MPFPFRKNPKEPDAILHSEETAFHNPDSTLRCRSGLFIIYESSKDVCNIDIIGVHGLNGDWETSWRGATSNQTWLQYFLPLRVNTARILSYGWDCRLVGGKNIATLRDTALNLVHSIESTRRTTGTDATRPIIFLCHSVGGILVKQALASAWHSTPSLISMTKGIIFLGTPHRGSELASVLSIALKWYGTSSGTRSVVKDIRPKSEYLIQLNRDFVALVNHTLIRISTFYETLPSAPFKTVVVNRESAELMVAGEHVVPMHSTHNNLNKFDSPESPEYRSLQAEIERMVDSVTSNTEGNVSNGAARDNGSDARNHPYLEELHDASVTHNADDSLSADEHLRNIRDRVLSLIRERECERHMRIAVIDSGVDLDHPQLKGIVERGQLKCMNFVKGEEGNKDIRGHGTHIVHCILKVAPDADVYAAKVFSHATSDELEERKHMIVEAINTAAFGWNADIIIMSWGFKENVPEIGAVIRRAFARGTILLAAGSNDGLNSQFTTPFPANLRQVISIGSSNGHGVPARSNAPASPDRNFTALGESVEAAWPTNLNQGVFRRQSGSSVATAIAGAIACLILQYAWSKGGPRHHMVGDPKRLNHCDEMRKVFYAMSNQHSNTFWLQPLKIFGKTGNQKHRDIAAQLTSILDSLEDRNF